jgi:two-component system LytT family response regulator
MRDHRILLVDDEKMARTNLLNKLISLGLESIQCEQADCGVSAVTMLRESSYDLVFMDINMPDLTAFEVLEQLADIDFLLVFVTAYDDYAISVYSRSIDPPVLAS